MLLLECCTASVSLGAHHARARYLAAAAAAAEAAKNTTQPMYKIIQACCIQLHPAADAVNQIKHA